MLPRFDKTRISSYISIAHNNLSKRSKTTRKFSPVIQGDFAKKEYELAFERGLGSVDISLVVGVTFQEPLPRLRGKEPNVNTT